jgi:hypothetical protein
LTTVFPWFLFTSTPTDFFNLNLIDSADDHEDTSTEANGTNEPSSRMRTSTRARRAPERYAPAVVASPTKNKARPAKKCATKRRAAVDRGIEQCDEIVTRAPKRERKYTAHERLVFSVFGEGSGLLRDRILAPMNMTHRALAIFSMLQIGIISRDQAREEWSHHITARYYWRQQGCIESGKLLPKLHSSRLADLARLVGFSGVSHRNKAALVSMLAPYAKSLEYTPPNALELIRAFFDERKRRQVVADIVGIQVMQDVHVPAFNIWDVGVGRANVLAALVQKPARYVDTEVLTGTLGLKPQQFEGVERKPHPRDQQGRWLLMSALRRAMEVHGDWQGVCRAVERQDQKCAEAYRRYARRQAKAKRLERELQREQREARRELAVLNT